MGFPIPRYNNSGSFNRKSSKFDFKQKIGTTSSKVGCKKKSKRKTGCEIGARDNIPGVSSSWGGSQNLKISWNKLKVQRRHVNHNAESHKLNSCFSHSLPTAKKKKLSSYRKDYELTGPRMLCKWWQRKRERKRQIQIIVKRKKEN